ncbi:MAG TPA: hypothetical protein VMT58_07945 [Candidatus Binataceae bacterium]|nr:hypothetical protein [Candidatus Binataceae bacterium]
MPVLFSDAAHDTETLLFWAILRKIDLDGRKTTFHFDNVKGIRGKHARQELILRTSRKPIADQYIRPYAICFTPEFLV